VPLARAHGCNLSPELPKLDAPVPNPIFDLPPPTLKNKKRKRLFPIMEGNPLAAPLPEQDKISRRLLIDSLSYDQDQEVRKEKCPLHLANSSPGVKDEMKRKGNDRFHFF